MYDRKENRKKGIERTAHHNINMSVSGIGVKFTMIVI